MTNFKASYENGVYSIEVGGHATGSVEVCAGISALCYALKGAADNSVGIIVKSIDVHDGHFDISFSGGIEARTAYDIITIGLLQIAQNFPTYCGGAIY